MDWCIDAPVGVGNDPGNSTPSEASESLLVWGGDEWQSSEMNNKAFEKLLWKLEIYALLLKVI